MTKPNANKKPETRRLQVDVRVETHAALRDWAAVELLPVAAIVRRVLRDAVANHNNPNTIGGV